MLRGDAAARGAPQLRGLEFLAAGDAAAQLVDDVPQGRADGDLHQARVADGARQSEDLGALGQLGAIARIPGRTAQNDRGNAGVGLHIVQHAGLAPEPCLGREGRAGTRFAALALDGSHEGGLLAAHEGAGAHADLQVEGEAAAEDVRAQEAPLPRLLDGNAQALDGQGILGPDIGVALAGPDGVARDDHGLDDAVGIPLQQAAVHEGAGIPLVAVAQHVLDVAYRASAQLPLEARGKARAAPPAQTRGLELSDDFVAAHGAEHLPQGFVTLMGHGIVDAEGIDDAAVPQGDLHLAVEEGVVLHAGHGLAALGLVADQALDHHTPRHGAVQDLIHIAQGQALVEDALGFAAQHRAPGTGPQTAGFHQAYIQTPAGQSLPQGHAQRH